MKNSALPNTIEQLFAAAFGCDLSLTEALYRHMALPDTAFLGTRITKKMLTDSASHNGIVLTTQEKQLISDGVQSIEWRYTLKPETINIAAWVTDQVEYAEVALLHVRLKPQITANDTQLHSCFNKLAKLLHKLIPYPLIVVVEHGEALALSLADKRINQADKTKWVVEHMYQTPWFIPKHLSGEQQAFLLDFSLKNAANLNYYALYQDLIAMLVSLESSKISGFYLAKNQTINSKFVFDKSTLVLNYDAIQPDGDNKKKVELLKKLHNLENRLKSIRSRLSVESQLSAKVNLNMQAKKIKEDIVIVKAELSR